jgi:tRNA pseudouridine38-40 synthase
MGSKEAHVRNIKLVLEYDGRAFHGWQAQKNGVSVQETLGRGVEILTGNFCLPQGAGRTDAGVHALGQVACFQTESRMPADRFVPALNAVLPETLSVVRAEEVPMCFHPRKDAVGKRYRYAILNRPCRSALLAGRVWHVPTPLSLHRLNEAAGLFAGTHNFKAFCASGHNVKSFERTILSSHWTTGGQDMLLYDVVGNGFLYNMVRILVGTMVDAVMGRFTTEQLLALLSEGDRTKAGKTAPASGLCMMAVLYDGWPDNGGVGGWPVVADGSDLAGRPTRQEGHA